MAGVTPYGENPSNNVKHRGFDDLSNEQIKITTKDGRQDKTQD